MRDESRRDPHQFTLCWAREVRYRLHKRRKKQCSTISHSTMISSKVLVILLLIAFIALSVVDAQWGCEYHRFLLVSQVNMQTPIFRRSRRLGQRRIRRMGRQRRMSVFFNYYIDFFKCKNGKTNNIFLQGVADTVDTVEEATVVMDEADGDGDDDLTSTSIAI